VQPSPYAGQDPYASGCSADARILKTATVGLGRVENWYSPGCRTQWAVEWWDGTTDVVNASVKIASMDHESDYEPTPFVQSQAMYAPQSGVGPGPQWTNMIDGTLAACVVAVVEKSDGEWGYTPGWDGEDLGYPRWDACA
jgi:hypothetical protein